MLKNIENYKNLKNLIKFNYILNYFLNKLFLFKKNIQ